MYKSSPQLTLDDIEGFTKDAPYITPLKSTAEDYINLLPDQLDLEESAWFREHFAGNNYITLIGSMRPSMYQLPLIDLEKRRNSKSFIHSILSTTPPSPHPVDLQEPIGIISVLEEVSKDHNSTITGTQYRIIIRHKNVTIVYYSS